MPKLESLPAERLSHAEILEQAKQVSQAPVLVAMLDTAPGLVALLNELRQIVFCNEACAKAGGLLRREDALGMRPGELLHCSHATETEAGCGGSESCQYCGLAQAVLAGQRGKAMAGECLLQCRDQETEVSAEYAVQVNPLPSLGTGWVCYSLADISDEKRREALERVFFHDIMNRASAVEGVTSVLQEEDIPEHERAEFLGILSSSAGALVEEIRSQRMLLAAERGVLASERIDCNSLDALHRAADSCRPFELPGGNRLEILADAQSIRLRTDPALLGRVLINLFKNAVEASQPGMRVTGTCAMAGPDRVRFSIHNDTLMPEAVRAHFFQRSYSTKGTGRGLGAYSVKLLTEQYLGGRTWFESAKGAGTTIHVELPV